MLRAMCKVVCVVGSDMIATITDTAATVKCVSHMSVLEVISHKTPRGYFFSLETDPLHKPSKNSLYVHYLNTVDYWNLKMLTI